MSDPTFKRQIFKIKCSNCGNDYEVPFLPKEGRPVYCSNCYRQLQRY
ncbi:CxxC-x17-CxxC domain-containing protein [[Eubacterium] cellulosolvens]